MYTSKLHPDCDYLWQKPRRGRVNYTDPVWFECSRVGHNPLETFMKKLCEEANLIHKDYTNHSIRATCISRLDRMGFEARHITALSSHKSESTIKEYSVKCPEVKKRQMFNALAAPITKKPKIEAQSSATYATESAITPVSTNPVPEPNLPDLNKMGALELLNMDENEDKLLINAINQIEKEMAQEANKGNAAEVPEVQEKNPINREVTVNNVNQLNRQMPVLPRMFFPNSNVTINFNLGK